MHSPVYPFIHIQKELFTNQLKIKIVIEDMYSNLRTTFVPWVCWLFARGHVVKNSNKSSKLQIHTIYTNLLSSINIGNNNSSLIHNFLPYYM